MSFINFPLWLVLTGAFSLVVFLYALQHLKAQPVVMRVASIQLWQEALQQTSTNKFWQQFRHWVGFLLAVLICLLLWLAISGPKFSDDAKKLHVYYLDTSVAMQAGDNMAEAKTRLEASFPGASSVNRALWIGDAVPATALKTDTSNAVLSAVLSEVRALSHVSAFSDWLNNLPAFYTGQDVTVHYYGPAPAEALTVPKGINIQKDYVSAPLLANAGITAIGQLRYMVAKRQLSSVTFTLLNSNGKPFQAGDYSVSLDGEPVDSSRIHALPGNQFVISDIVLTQQPQRVTVTLTEADDFKPDNTTTILLPPQSRIFVALQSGLPAWISQFVIANPLLSVDPERANVSICIVNDNTCPDAETTLYADDSSNVVTVYTPHQQDEKMLREIWQANHWQGQTSASGMPELNVKWAQTRAVSVPMKQLEDLVDNQLADPLLLLSMTLNWLAEVPDSLPYLAIGESAPKPPSPALQSHNTVDHFPLYRGQSGAAGMTAPVASLQSPFITEQVATAREATATAMAAPERAFPWLTLIILTALGLLIFEWLMIQHGRWA